MNAQEKIEQAVRAAGITLRFDKVARRLMERLKSASSATGGDAVAVVTVTAPILQPGKTASALESLAISAEQHRDVCTTLNGNHVSVRRVLRVRTPMPKVLVFVHNRVEDAPRILALAEKFLTDQDYPG